MPKTFFKKRSQKPSTILLCPKEHLTVNFCLVSLKLQIVQTKNVYTKQKKKKKKTRENPHDKKCFRWLLYDKKEVAKGGKSKIL